jgi:hypothetical protein
MYMVDRAFENKRAKIAEREHCAWDTAAEISDAKDFGEVFDMHHIWQYTKQYQPISTHTLHLLPSSSHS